MRLLSLLRLFLASALLPTCLAAQATADEARLALSIGLGGTTAGGTVWNIRKQALVVDPGDTDTLSLSRHFRNSLDVVFSGTYFPGEHFGLNFEAQILGVGTRDACSPVYTQGQQLTNQVCNSIEGAENAATSASLSIGGIYRVLSRHTIHPYVRANLGVLISQQSFVRMAGTYTVPDSEVSEMEIYTQDQYSSVRPYASIGAGLVVVVGRGYQLRLEGRDNWIRIPVVAGPSVRQGLNPPTDVVGKHLFSLIVAFDVVLERKRGRRY